MIAVHVLLIVAVVLIVISVARPIAPTGLAVIVMT